MAHGAKLIVVACNTATIAAVETLRAEYPISFVGMEPAVKPAVATTRSGIVGVLATGASLAGEKFHRLVERHASGVRVLTQPCPGLVELVEEGDLDGPRTEELVRRFTAPLLAAGADTLVLGCTHYAFLRPLLAQAAGPDVALVDTGEAVARRTADLLARDGLEADGGRGRVEWFSSGAGGEAVLARLWGAPVAVQPLPASG
jgi:glutamate racemase